MDLVTNNSDKINMMYENNSGDLLIAWGRDKEDELGYAVWDGSVFVNDTVKDGTLVTAGKPEWIELAQSPKDKNISMVYATTAYKGGALEWDGDNNAWTCENPIEVGGLTPTRVHKVDTTYEDSSGDIFTVYGINATTEFNITRKDKSTCDFNNTQSASMDEESDDISIAPVWGTDKIIIAVHAFSGADTEWALWNISAMSPNDPGDSVNNQLNLTSSADGNSGQDSISPACVVGNDTCIINYPDFSNFVLDWAKIEPSTETWITPADFTTTPIMGGNDFAINCYPYPSGDYYYPRILCTMQDQNADLFAKTYNASAGRWYDSDGGAALEISLGGDIIKHFRQSSFDFLKYNITSGVLDAPVIGFGPNVSLENPTDYKIIINPRFNVTFNFTPYQGTNALKNATIYGNWSDGVFKINNSNLTALTHNTLTGINVTGIPNGTWIWNVLVCDTQHNCTYNTTNFTFKANNAPNITNITIFPAGPTASDSLLANLSALNDYDGEYQVQHNNVSYNWYVANRPITILSLPFTNNIYSDDNRTTFDYSSNELAGRLYGFRGLSTGLPVYTKDNCTIGGCYRFNSSNYINITDPNNLTLGMNNFSILFWYDPEGTNITADLNNPKYIFSRNYSSSDVLSVQIAKNTTQISVYLAITNRTLNTRSSKIDSVTTNNPDKKVFIAITRNGNTGNVTVIFNGTASVSKDSDPNAVFGPLISNVSNINAYLGSSAADSTNGLGGVNGTIDEFMIFNRTLTPEQVKSIYNSGVGNYSILENEELLNGESWNVSAVPIDNDGLNGSRVISSNVTITQATSIACTWSNAALNVSFGQGLSQSLTQGSIYNASKNFEGYTGGGAQNTGINWTHYNVTADSTNTAPINITIKADHLTSGTNVIGIGNITWMTNESNGNATDNLGNIHNFTYLGSFNSSIGPGTNFEGFNLTLIKDGDPKLATRNRNFSNQLTAGSTSWYRFWLLLPKNQVQGTYTGNYTMECAAAS